MGRHSADPGDRYPQPEPTPMQPDQRPLPDTQTGGRHAAADRSEGVPPAPERPIPESVRSSPLPRLSDDVAGSEQAPQRPVRASSPVPPYSVPRPPAQKAGSTRPTHTPPSVTARQPIVIAPVVETAPVLSESEQSGNGRTIARRGLIGAAVLGVAAVATTALGKKLGWWNTSSGNPAPAPSPDAPRPRPAPTETFRNLPPEFDRSREVDLIKGGTWAYMPGAKVVGDGLRMTGTGLAIRKEGGGGYIPNPPVNVYGTHLKSGNSNFGMAARVSDIQDGESATLYFQGDPTFEYDERKYVHAGAAVTVKSGKLFIQLWRGNGEDPDFETELPITTGNSVDVWIKQEDNKLTIGAGEQKLELDESVFKDTGEVWFGADANGGNGFTLADFKAFPLQGAGNIEAVDTSKLTFGKRDPHGLQGLSDQTKRRLPIGTAVDLTPLMYDAEFARLVVGNFGSIETEMLAKPQAVQPRPGGFEFGPLDALVDFAKRHDLDVYGHTLVFGEANPKWMEDAVNGGTPAQALGLMKGHIKSVVGRYKGQIKAWDVVNEPFDADEWDQPRMHMWAKKIGYPHYIEEAFRTAHEADPNALLFMNEWALEMDDDRWNACINLVTGLQAKGVPIHGIGFQCHVFEEDIENGDQLDKARIAQRFKQLNDMGLKVRISEISVPDQSDPEDGSNPLTFQAQQYADALQACLDAPNCIGFNMWGPASSPYYFTSEPNSDYEFSADDGSIGNDAPWREYVPRTKPVEKPAVEAMRRVLRLAA